MKTDTRGRLDGVAVFVEAVEAGGFARAAERLALSRSAVGKSIARLETRLGVRLFHRTTRTQNLTEDGQIYYERCLRAIEELRVAESLLESGKQEVAGRLRMTMPVLFGRYCIAPILLDFAREHPKLELELSFSDRPVDMIAEGFDLGIRSGALGEATGLCARPLATQPKVLCAAPDYLKARGEPDTIETLATHDVLIHWRTGHPYPWLLPGADGRLTEVRPASRLRFDDLEVTADAAVAGMGIAWLPHWLVRDRIQAGALVALWEKRPAASMDSHAIWPATDYMPLRVRLAIDTLVEKLPGVVVGVTPPTVRPGRHAQGVTAVSSPSSQQKQRRTR
ncbi:LysR family transcriptional regulator [Ralstonia solanacearum]|uniref:LysR family transcriptional regulator n=1 Tax=Ralstonia solanacearum TaxID=305 RepID=A0AAE3T687_RALSL|nr:LysR family transcriptional regulator [Ralstonia solanacearum]MBB6581711.1 LysR family transcriptional regulator [Ralstonia solanacearum]MDB0523708.1 LysR family transcriptional regulator [Ralstonia solanacearum]